MSISNLVKSQLISHGSYSITAVSKDGIILGVDSRAGWNAKHTSDLTDTINKNPLGYYDYVEKIFCFDNFALSYIGYGSIGNHTIYYYLSKFKNQIDGSVNVDNVIFKFYDFIDQNYHPIINDILKLKFQVAGYISGKPHVSFNNNATHEVKYGHSEIGQDNFICCDTLSDFDKSYSANNSCEENANIIEKTIIDYAKKYGETKVIGGAIRVLKIAPDNKIEWIKNGKKAIDYMTIKDFYVDFQMGKMKINFKDENSKELWESLMKELFKKEGVKL